MVGWSRVEVDESDFLFSDSRIGDKYRFHLTNMVYVYQETLTEPEISSRLQELNPDLEGLVVDEIVGELCKAVLETKGLKAILLEDVYELDLSWEYDGIPLLWKFYLRRGCPEEFSEIFTSQIIKSIDGLLEERKQLFKIIRDKDIELGEFKNSGLKVTRPHLRTQWFKEENFINHPLNPTQRSEMEILCSSDTLNLLHRLENKQPEVETFKPEIEITKPEEETSKVGTASTLTQVRVINNKDNICT
jgi:hypothetical protein